MDNKSQAPNGRIYTSCFWTADELENPSAIKYDGRIVELDDIPGTLRDIAEVLGMKFVLDLSSICGGQWMYVHELESIYRAGRNREIMRRFNGSNYAALAKTFNLHERYVRKIIRRGLDISAGIQKDWTGPL